MIVVHPSEVVPFSIVKVQLGGSLLEYQKHATMFLTQACCPAVRFPHNGMAIALAFQLLLCGGMQPPGSVPAS
jgi:hypothetical protein